MEKAVLFVNHPKDACPDGGEDFVRVELIRPGNIVAGFDELFEGSDTDFKKLVEVRTDNREEFKAFE
jgi:hypothetical protein